MGLFNTIFRNNRKNDLKETSREDIILVLTKYKTYNVQILNITKIASEKFNRILYLSINKPAKTMLRLLRSRNIDIKKIIFVDAVTKGAKKNTSDGNILFINSPKNIKNFEEELNQILEKEKADCFIFDSLSTMRIYQDDDTVIKYVHELTTKLRTVHAFAELIYLVDHEESDVLSKISIFADRIIYPEEDYTKISAEALENEGLILKYDKELIAIEQAHAAKLLSDSSYYNSRVRISKKLNKLKTIDVEHLIEN